MIKLSGLDPLLVATPLAALVSDFATRKSLDLLQDKGMEHLNSLPTSRREKSLMRQVKNDYGIDVGYAYAPRLSRGNAGFLTRDDIKGYLGDNPDLDPKLKDMLSSKSGKHGLVLAGKGWKKPGVMEHEFGHAVAEWRGTPMEKAVHRPWVEYYARYYHNVPSHMTGGMVGRLKGALPGILAGALAGLTTGSPKIYRESVADRYGQELMTEKDKERVKNWPFLGSYVARAAVPAAVTGGIIGGAAQLLKLLKRSKQ